MNDSTNIQLKDIAEIIMGQSPSGDSCNISKHGLPLLNGPTEFGSHHPVPVQYTTDPKKLSEEGDLLFCVRGSTTGRMNWSNQRYAIGRGLAAIRSTKNKKYSSFIKGCLEVSLPNLLMSATGSTFPSVSRDQLESIPIILPPSKKVEFVETILGTLDKRIELNKKTNETLEEVAKSLFKSWFIDFDPVKAKAQGHSTGLPEEITNLLPDSFDDSEIGNIPKNWNVKKLGNVISIKYGKNFPTKNLLERGFPVFGGNGIIGYHSSFLYKEEMTLMSCRGAASGSILRSLPESFITNNSLVMDHASNKFPSQRYVEYFLQSTDRSGFITGSAQPQVTIESIYELSFLVPNYELVKYFQNLITPLNQRSLLIKKQNKNLELLRNTLLPKLISGELRITDAEKMIDEVLYKCPSKV